MDEAQRLWDAYDPEHVESFLAARLVEAGVWNSVRVSDGVTFVRVVERTAEVLELCGSLFTVTQVQQTFWVSLRRTGDAVEWKLFLDVVGTERFRRHALELCSHADEVSWSVSLAGRMPAGRVQTKEAARERSRN